MENEEKKNSKYRNEIWPYADSGNDIKNVVTPSYYCEFHCIDRECTDTCCAGWQVDVDQISWNSYISETSEYGDFMRGVMEVTPDGERRFRIRKDGRCPFLLDDGYCDMYIHLGEDSLCHTCANFPRYMEDYGDRREVGVAMSCPEAARIIISDEHPLKLESHKVNSGDLVADDVMGRLEKYDTINALDRERSRYIRAAEMTENKSVSSDTSRDRTERDHRTAGAENESDYKSASAGEKSPQSAENEDIRSLKSSSLIEILPGPNQQQTISVPIFEEKFDRKYFDCIDLCRTSALDLVADKGLTVQQRAALLLYMGMRLQTVIDDKCNGDLKGNDFKQTLESVLEDFRAGRRQDQIDQMRTEIMDKSLDPDAFQLYGEPLVPGEFRQKLIPEYMYVIYGELKPCKPEWRGILKKAGEIIASATPEKLSELDRKNADIESAFQHILEYCIFRYFDKAYFDDDIYGKCQLTVMAYVIVKAVYFAGICRITDPLDPVHECIEPGTDPTQDSEFRLELLADVAHLYSRELEHSKENYDIFRDELATENMANGDHLIALLLENM